MAAFISKTLPSGGKLADVKVLYCQKRGRFYSASYGAGNWHWTELCAQEIESFVRAGWTIAATQDIALFLHAQNEGE